MSGGASPPTISYHLNEDDEIVSVNEAWAEFAAANGAPFLMPEAVLHHSLWEFIVDDTTRQLYMAMLVKARTGRTLEFTFRCDAPDRRRVLGMRIECRGAEFVRFESRELTCELRDAQRLLDPSIPRQGSWLRMCSWCKRILVGGRGWLEVEVGLPHLGVFHDDPMPPVTHGICPQCHSTLVNVVL